MRTDDKRAKGKAQQADPKPVDPSKRRSSKGSAAEFEPRTALDGKNDSGPDPEVHDKK